jgi:hypothetical protein
MITRENVVELAQFESPENGAVSFYFQPGVPQNKAHREETIRVREAVRQAMQQAEKNKSAREDLERVLATAERLPGNVRLAKAIFACGAKGFWREYDLPPQLAGTWAAVGRRFRLRPLTPIAGLLPRVAIALIGRSRFRWFELWMGEMREKESFSSELPRRSRSDGFAGYDAGHAERRVDQEAQHHFKRVAERLQQPGYDRLIIGCRDETWADMEPQLHAYARGRLIGRFVPEWPAMGADAVRREAERVLNDFREQRRRELCRRVKDEAKAQGHGALGIKRVLRSLEAGEVQTLLLGEGFAAPAVICSHCGHVDPLRASGACASCGGETRRVEDVADLLLGTAVRNGIEIVHVPPEEEFEKIGNVAALLRFRADQNTNVMQQAG